MAVVVVVVRINVLGCERSVSALLLLISRFSVLFCLVYSFFRCIHSYMELTSTPTDRSMDRWMSAVFLIGEQWQQTK